MADIHTSAPGDNQDVQGDVSGGQDFGEFFQAVPGGAGRQSGGPGRQAGAASGSKTGHGPRGQQSDAGSGQTSGSNFGLARKTGNKRVIGAASSKASTQVFGDITRSYRVVDSLQFNDVEEMQADAISRAFAQEIIEELFVTKWGLDTRDPIVMRKAEDVLFSFVIMRTASPYAEYQTYVMVGGNEVSMQALSDLLVDKEVQRRRFTRAIADDLRKFILVPENVKLRNLLITTLAIYPQYVHLAFDGSTKCSGMNRNEIAFTRALESTKLFDDASVQGSLTNASLLDGIFDTGSNVRRRPVA